MTHWIETVRMPGPDGELRWRLVEGATGGVVRQWLPGDPPDDEPIDMGGWPLRDHADATGFALGVLWWRAVAGCLGDFRPSDIDQARERHERSPRQPLPVPPPVPKQARARDDDDDLKELLAELLGQGARGFTDRCDVA